MEFGWYEIEKVPLSHVGRGRFEHPQHCRIGQMDSSVGAGDNYAVRRKLGQQAVSFFACAQRFFSLFLSGDVSLYSPDADNHSVLNDRAQAVQDDFGISVPIHFVCLDIVEVVTVLLKRAKKFDVLWIRSNQQLSNSCTQN